MNDAMENHLGLPAIDQVGMVVKDLDAAIEQYNPLFGPFSTMDGSIEAAEFRGRKSDAVLKLAFGKSGDLEIELIEWVSGETPHREFIESGREGLHHIRYRVDDCDACIEKLAELGYSSIWYKAIGEDIKFAYLEREGDPLLLEFLQMPST